MEHRIISGVGEVVGTLLWRDAGYAICNVGVDCVTARACALRIQCRIFAKTCSIGLRSGEQSGKDAICALASRMAWHRTRLVATGSAENDNVTRPHAREEELLNVATEYISVDRTIDDTGFHQNINPQRYREWACPNEVPAQNR